MNDEELETLLSGLESDRVERKASISDRNVIRQAICAFANDLPNHQQPGVLFIGVNNDGTCANLPITDQLLLTLSDVRSDGKILPFPSMFNDRIEIQNPGGPYQFKNKIWIGTHTTSEIVLCQ